MHPGHSQGDPIIFHIKKKILSLPTQGSSIAPQDKSIQYKSPKSQALPIGPCVNWSHHLSFISRWYPFRSLQIDPSELSVPQMSNTLSHPGLHLPERNTILPISILSCRSRLLSLPPNYLPLPPHHLQGRCPSHHTLYQSQHTLF